MVLKLQKVVLNPQKVVLDLEKVVLKLQQNNLRMGGFNDGGKPASESQRLTTTVQQCMTRFVQTPDQI